MHRQHAERPRKGKSTPALQRRGADRALPGNVRAPFGFASLHREIPSTRQSVIQRTLVSFGLFESCNCLKGLTESSQGYQDGEIHAQAFTKPPLPPTLGDHGRDGQDVRVSA